MTAWTAARRSRRLPADRSGRAPLLQCSRDRRRRDRQMPDRAASRRCHRWRGVPASRLAIVVSAASLCCALPSRRAGRARAARRQAREVVGRSSWPLAPVGCVERRGESRISRDQILNLGSQSCCARRDVCTIIALVPAVFEMCGPPLPGGSFSFGRAPSIVRDHGAPSSTNRCRLSSVTSVLRPIFTVCNTPRPIRRHAVAGLVRASTQTSLIVCRRRRGVGGALSTDIGSPRLEGKPSITLPYHHDKSGTCATHGVAKVPKCLLCRHAVSIGDRSPKRAQCAPAARFFKLPLHQFAPLLVARLLPNL